MPQDPTATTDVAVIGGGIIGLAIAWRAAQRGLTVCVLERGEQPGTGASRVAAGMLAPVTEADAGELALLELGLRSARAWPAFAHELEQASGADPGLRRSGALVVARDRDEAEALERELGLRIELGLEVQRLLPSAARRLEPALAPTVRLALDVPGDHCADPRAVVHALAQAARRAGVTLRTGATVERVEQDAGRVTGVALAGGDVVRARRVVAAAGAWSGAIAGLPRIPLRPVKGQILRLRDPDHGPGRGLLERIVRFEGGYLVPRGDGRYVLGATMEERGFDTTVSAGGLYELLRDAGELVPGVHELVIEEMSAGLRPATPDNAPLLGPAAELEGLHWATGHHRNGILLAPVSADIVVDGLTGGGEGVGSAFAAARFSGVHA
ncbi:MAG: Glycine oxidase ThiO [uncultured Solirubrobacteraceae bacterium]|uniref:glycine oxidase n=1 Tax=uncultured Solirubrobacteraceae bacterium TaxID=1162706 RepID=A0A6J4S4I0_9ACTN|nr:MAG: Glycine oxidase ThiO [uncultured Solirubrobacteraceae bacterium]